MRVQLVYENELFEFTTTIRYYVYITADVESSRHRTWGGGAGEGEGRVDKKFDVTDLCAL